jgi:subtilisin family serine protease
VAIVATALTLVLLGASSAIGATPSTDHLADPPGSPATPVNTDVIVQWQRGSDHAERTEAREDVGVTYGAELGDPSFQLVETTEGESAAAAARALEADPAVALAEPDRLRKVEAVPNDPLFSEEWGLQNTGQTVDGLVGKSGNDIDVVPAWNRTVGTPNTVVADIDTGYRADSPDLGPVLWTNPGEIPGNGIDDDHNGYADDVHGWDFVGENANVPTEDADPTDSNVISGGHGVHTAGIIGAAGNNGTGISGVARNVRIMPLRVCANEPSSNEARCPTSSIIAAINYAGKNGARVANLSLGGTVFSQAEVNAFAANPGTLYVIAAGNDSANNDSGGSGTAGHHYPCDYKPGSESNPVVPGAIENTICVAALDPGETLASYSDYGATSVDLGAPGTAVLSTFPATETLFSDDFETNNFATRWTTFGAAGFARSNESPLTSFGMTDTPGAAPQANHIYGVELTSPISVAAGTGACMLEGKRFRKGGSMPYGVIVDGTDYEEFNGGETSGSAMTTFRTVPIIGLAGHSAAPFFEYRAGAAPTAAEGAWLDDLALRCNAPLSVPPTYSFLEGTSMAAPQVSGAAALLFSLKPSATVTEVREALLETTTPVTGLAGKTVTGGRLNVNAALNHLVPPGQETTAPETEFVTTPAADASPFGWKSEFQFRRVDADGGTFECKLDSRPFEECAAVSAFAVSEGTHTLEVRAKNEAGVVDPTPASFTGAVDDTPPTIAITTGPSGTTTDSGATFEFTAGTDPSGPVTTSCMVDGAMPTPCTSPVTYSSLADGEHEFSVVAEDAVGNGQTTSRSWTIDTSPPTLAITEGPSGTTTETGATLRFTATDPHGPVTTECSLDGAIFAACTSPTFYGPLAVGGHEFKVRAEDALGHATTATRNWTVTASPPPPPGTVTVFLGEEQVKANPPAPTEPTPVATCTVPKLVGKTRGQAEAALSAAGCKLGKVSSPRGVRGARLVVKSSGPAAGSKVGNGTVSLRLGAKPKRRHH